MQAVSLGPTDGSPSGGGPCPPLPRELVVQVWCWGGSGGCGKGRDAAAASSGEVLAFRPALRASGLGWELLFRSPPARLRREPRDGAASGTADFGEGCGFQLEVPRWAPGCGGAGAGIWGGGAAEEKAGELAAHLLREERRCEGLASQARKLRSGAQEAAEARAQQEAQVAGLEASAAGLEAEARRLHEEWRCAEEACAAQPEALLRKCREDLLARGSWMSRARAPARRS